MPTHFRDAPDGGLVKVSPLFRSRTAEAQRTQSFKGARNGFRRHDPPFLRALRALCASAVFSRLHPYGVRAGRNLTRADACGR